MPTITGLDFEQQRRNKELLEDLESCDLNGWEIDFADSISEQLQNDKQLTARQRDTMNDIINRHN